MYPKTAKCPECASLMQLLLFTDPYPESAEKNPRPSVFYCSRCGVEVPASEVREVCTCGD